MVGNIPSQVPRGEMLMGSVLFLQRARGLPYNNNDAYVMITTKIDAPIKDDPAQSVVTASRLVIYSMLQQHLLYSLVIDGPDKPNQPRRLHPNVPIDVPKPYAVSSADLASAFAMIFCPTSMLYFWNAEVTLESVSSPFPPYKQWTSHAVVQSGRRARCLQKNTIWTFIW